MKWRCIVRGSTGMSARPVSMKTSASPRCAVKTAVREGGSGITRCELLLFGAIAVILLGLGLTFLAILLTVLLWDSHRLLALAVFATVFLTLGAVAGFAARARLARGSRLFEASLAELDRDKQSLGP